LYSLDDAVLIINLVLENQLESMKLLVERKCNLELQEDEGFTPLMTAIWKAREEMIKFLLTRRARVDSVDKSKRTPLHLAVLRNNIRAVAMLLAVNANVNSSTGICYFRMYPIELLGSGMTPLHIATSKGYEDIVKYLLQHGADLTAREEAKTVLHLAVIGNRNKLLELFLQHPNGKDLIDFQDSDGRTALLIAAQMDNVTASTTLHLVVW
jgi:ankyrin repeat protein